MSAFDPAVYGTVFADLFKNVRLMPICRVAGSSWAPNTFIDLCEAANGGRIPAEDLCQRIQQREWELLFDYPFHHAIG